MCINVLSFFLRASFGLTGRRSKGRMHVLNALHARIIMCILMLDEIDEI